MEPLAANSWTEVYFYLKVTPCGDCGQGPWEMQAKQQEPPAAQAEDGADRSLRARCVHCGVQREFLFRCIESPHGRQLEPLGLEPVNPTGQPSRIIDLAGWLSLFYMLVESASKAPDKAIGRRLTFQAAQCLDEALKFYADDDLPSANAFFSERSRQTFADHPEKFTRERLRQMRTKLPDLNVMVRRLAGDEAANKKRWWQFWR